MSSDALTPPFYSSSAATSSSLLPQPQSSSSAATSAIIVVIVIASAIILSVSIYLLLRFLSRNLSNRRRHHQTHPNDVVLSRHSSTSGEIRASADRNGAALLESLPLFTFRSVNKGNLTEGDCAVCLSRFEPDDQLRLLPLCCHAFHGACIDAWIVANRTCPLCRSSVVPTDRDVMDKINHSGDPVNSGNEDGLNESNRSRSFRIEIGSISRRRNGGGASAEGDRRSYSVGSFEYIVDQIGEYEVSLADYADKEYPTSIGAAAAAEEALAAEVGSGGGRSGSHNWLRDYVDRLGVSFRSSGRFFSGSSRRSEAAVTAVLEDLEANRVGEEISELFRWLSGV